MQKPCISRASDDTHTPQDCWGLLSGLLILSLNVLLIMPLYWSCKRLCLALASRSSQGPWAVWHQRFKVVRISYLLEPGLLINRKVFQRRHCLNCSIPSQNFSFRLPCIFCINVSVWSLCYFFSAQMVWPNDLLNIQVLSKLGITCSKA